MIKDKISAIINGLSNSEQHNFANSVCLALADTIEADYVFIALLNSEQTIATTTSLAANGTIAENFAYDLNHTPCANVVAGNVCSHQQDIQQLYPNDQLLIDMGISGYIGIPLKNEEDEVVAILAALYRHSITDVEEVESIFLLFSGVIQKELEKQKFYDKLQLSNTVIEESREAIVICDSNNKIIGVNKAFTNISGFTLKEVIGKDPSVFGTTGVNCELQQRMWDSINETGGWSGEVWNTRKNGEEFPEWLSVSAIYDNNTQEVSHFVSFFIDITEQKKAEDKIYRQANFDLLTGLANRFLFVEKISEVLSAQEQAAIVSIDLDLFREINDTNGHEFGDHVLIAVANRLSSMLKPQDLAARISGDNFAILLHNTTDQYEVERFMISLIESFQHPFYVDKSLLRCTISAGVVTFAKEALTPFELIKKAEHAMYHAKENGRNTYSFFTQNMQNHVLHRLALKSDLQAALANSKLSVYFQPIVTTASQTVDTFEALVRWKHGDSWISPVEFIPIAEEFGLIKQIGAFVLKESCIVLNKLKEQGFNNIKFNINRSVYEIPLSEIDNDCWLEEIANHGLQPSDICFELTESALAPEKRNNEVLFRRLQHAGSTIALDDFGTGYSSLAYLRRFHIDILKIDKSFINDLTTDSEAHILVSTIIAMAKALGITTVAEGVETKEQLEELTKLNCDKIQGYYFSKPLPATQIFQYLAEFEFKK